MKKEKPEMTAQDVIDFIQLLDQNNIEIWVDGGWGVDALLGRQTRAHDDLDIAIQHKDVPLLCALLKERGYADVPRNDTWECNFVLGDEQGHLIDVHSYTFDIDGNCVFGVKYPFLSLSGSGTINGFPVRCISPQWMVKFHSGYELDENDYQDVKLLCQHFGIKIPCEYTKFENQQ